MKPDYKNWIPKWIKNLLMLGTMTLWTLLIGCGVIGSTSTAARLVVTAVLGIAFVICLCCTVWCVNAYDAYDYKGKRQIARRIVDGIADEVKLSDDATCLDVGCGTGALTIACAKRNPTATVVGIDVWKNRAVAGDHKLCKRNADCEGVSNVAFSQGDALSLDFDDETFDAVVSNYCYHTISRVDRQDVVMESLRVLKKGGTFVLHDIMAPDDFGDIEHLRQRLLDMGYQRVEIVDTADGKFVDPRLAKRLRITHSRMLLGVK